MNKKIEEIKNRLENYGCPDSYLDNEVKWWLELIDQAVEDGVRGFGEYIKLNRDMFYNKPPLFKIINEEIETYLQSLDEGDKDD